MSIPKMTNDLAVIQKLSDLPNSTEGLSAEQLKAKFDEAPQEIQKYINERLIPSIAAAEIPFTPTSAINANNVDAAIRNVQEQVRNASSGTIVNGSVTKEKLADALLERVYGGRPWVSMDTPGSADNPNTDFPIGQIWLRPGFTLVNSASNSWTANGCSVATGANKITVTGNGSVATATITQSLSSVGQSKDRVYVLFSIQNKDSRIRTLTVSLNNGQAQDASSGVCMATLSSSSLSIKFSATWGSTSQANGSFDIVNYTVVNVDKALRQTPGSSGVSDWASYLSGLIPFSNYTAPEEVFIQSASGVWAPLNYPILPVSRGGIGKMSVGYGEMLYGTGGDALERLSAASEDNSLLTFSGGHPVWAGFGSMINNNGILRVTTGSYVGNQQERTISLPVEPKLLFISTPNGCWDGTAYNSGRNWVDRPCTLAQNSSDSARYEVEVDGGTQTRTASASLNGRSIALSGPYFCNRSNVTYNWVAIY